MNEPNLDDLSQYVPSKFTLVTLAMKRARQIKAGAPKLIDTPSQKPVTIALQEILLEKVRPLPMPPAEELEAQEQAELLAAIGLSEPTSVSVARRMEEIVYGADEEGEEVDEYDEDFMEDEEEEEEEEEREVDLGLDEELETDADETRPEAGFLPDEEETEELSSELGLDEIADDGEAAEEEEEEDEVVADEAEEDPFAARRPVAPVADEETAAPKKRAGRPAKAKVAEEPEPAAEAEAPAPKKPGRKPKA